MRNLKKKPIQIYIEPEQDTMLDILAEQKGVSKAAIIRDGIERLIAELPVEDDPAMGLIGIGKSGRRDLSEKHDKYLVAHMKSKKK
jgi:Ribbon-helix-helix domain